MTANNILDEYNRLVEEILSKNLPLTLQDELRFYELHNQVQAKNIEAAYKLVEYCQWLEGTTSANNLT